MYTRLKSPSQYIQGPGVSRGLGNHLSGMGSRILILMSEGGFRRFWPAIETSCAGTSAGLLPVLFGGECSWTELQRVVSCGKEGNASRTFGIGGGKVLDTAKGAAFLARLPVGIMPTSAATDSPCSSLSVVYHEDGTFDRYLFLDRCPDTVLVDTQWICKAPPALLAAGMGDAMATWFEARACRASGKKNQAGGLPTKAASALAHLCWDILQRDGKTRSWTPGRDAVRPLLNILWRQIHTFPARGLKAGGWRQPMRSRRGLPIFRNFTRLITAIKLRFARLSNRPWSRPEGQKSAACWIFAGKWGFRYVSGISGGRIPRRFYCI